jgi:hypothetical protein
MKKLILLFPLGVVLAACGEHELTPQEHDTAELGAVKYSQAAGGKFMSCSGMDSDGDYYVTCTIAGLSGAPEPLLCSYKSQGCKQK